MPAVVSDIVDVYVFRRLNARVQFLLLQRRPDVAMPHTWQGFHTPIQPGEATLDAARRAVRELAGLNVSAFYSADYVNQFFDDYRDVLVLAPVIAVNVSPQAPVSLGSDFRDCAWFDRDEATVRLPFSGQRWAVRHIDELMSISERESELYRLDPDSRADALPVPEVRRSSVGQPALSIAETYDEVAMPSDPTSNDFPILDVANIFTDESPDEIPTDNTPEPAPATDIDARLDALRALRNADLAAQTDVPDVTPVETDLPTEDSDPVAAASAEGESDAISDTISDTSDEPTQNPSDIANRFERFKLRPRGSQKRD